MNLWQGRTELRPIKEFETACNDIMLTGPQLIELLSSELAEIRGEAADLETEREQTDRRLDELVNSRGNALMSLAQHYLPTLTLATIQTSFSGVRDELTGLLERQQRSQQQLVEREERLKRQYETALEQLQALQATHDELVRLRTQKEQEIATFLQQDPSFQSMSNATLQAEQRLTQNELRLQEIQQDAREKLPPYQASSLFQYLLKRKFGTSEYSDRGLIRELDWKVARLIRFPDLKESFDFLTTTPALMEHELERRKQEFKELMQQVEEAEQQAEQQFGLTTLTRQCQEHEQKLQQQSDSTAQKHRTLSDVQTEVAQLASTAGQFYLDALERFRSFLNETEVNVLAEHAQQTASRVDDDLVSEIQFLNSEIDDMQETHSRINEGKTRHSRHIKDLEYVIRRCQQTDVATERCTFSQAFGIKGVLRQFRQDALDGRGLWELIKREQIVAPQWSEETRDMITDAMRSPQSRVLLQAMTQVAAVALREAVGRSLTRRK